MTLAELFSLAQREGDYEEWAGQLWLERGKVLERIGAGGAPRAEFSRLRRNVAEEGSLGRLSGGSVQAYPTDPGRLL